MSARKWLFGGIAAAAAAVLCVPAANVYYRASWGGGCVRCHEIRFDYDQWSRSSHRNINCIECHSSSPNANLRRVVKHVKGDAPEQVHLGSEDVFAMVSRCERCHRQEFAEWSSGAHSATYARLFTDRAHNRKRLLMDDCLRCHGMHFEGAIGDLVEPVSTAGPWLLKDAAYADRPAIPCLACHSVHRTGTPMSRPAERVR